MSECFVVVVADDDEDGDGADGTGKLRETRRRRNVIDISKARRIRLDGRRTEVRKKK